MSRAVKVADHDGGKAARPRSTRERILDTAEQLFASKGVLAVTLRSIAAAAEVNVAAVNYHFGTKEKLFDEMFQRRIAPLNEERLAGLKACIARADGAPSLEAIVEAYVMPAARLADASGASARAIIVQYSLGRILAMPEANRMLVRYYDRLRREYVAALRRALPELSTHEVVWRYYWMGGSLMCALAVPPGMVETPPEPGSEERRGASESMADSLIAFLVSGFRSKPLAGAPRTAARA